MLGDVTESITLGCFKQFIAWDHYIYHSCPILLFVDHNSVQLVSHHLAIRLDLEVPQALSMVILNHIWRGLPF